ELINMDSSPQKVTVTLRGNERWLSRTLPGDIKIRADVDASRFIPGQQYNLRIMPEDIKTPLGLRVTAVNPENLCLILEQRISKPVAIKAKFNSRANLSHDYAVGNVNINPATAMVTGAKSVVEKIEAISTEPIPLDANTMESFEYQIKLADNYLGITVTPDTVTAEVEIVREYLTRTFETLPIRIMTGVENAKMMVEFNSTPHVNVTISGLRGNINNLRPEMVRPYIDISGLDKPGSYSVDVGCWTDAKNTRVVSIYPRQVQVRLTEK
ncbi:MAG: CdaR family protein, partial [Victivallales bacterium]|nr:CdaR family protein [Victivallales bacterium]